MHPAMDLTAGEKERGTMETILSSPISRSHLVLGKFLLVSTTALTTAALSVISMGISFAIANALRTTPVQAGEQGAALHIGFGAALSVFIMAVPLAVLFSSVLITISTFAKSYKKRRVISCPSFSSSSSPRSRDAARGGAYSQARDRSHPECKPPLQGTCHWHLPLELHCHHLCIHLRLRRRRPLHRHQNVPARIRPLPLLASVSAGRSPRRTPCLSRLGTRSNAAPSFLPALVFSSRGTASKTVSLSVKSRIIPLEN